MLQTSKKQKSKLEYKKYKRKRQREALEHTITYKVEQRQNSSHSKSSKSKSSKSRSKSNSEKDKKNKKHKQVTMVIDDLNHDHDVKSTIMDPTATAATIMPSTMPSVGLSIIPSAYNMENIEINVDDENEHKNEPLSYTMNTSPVQPSTNKPVLNDDDKQIVEILNVMTKMTLLIIIAVISSILSVIGNIFVEVHELQFMDNTMKDHAGDTDSLYAFTLPVIDMIVTSFMLYLQFNFASNIYLKMCGRFDILLLKLCLKLLGDDDKKKKQKEMKNNIDYMVQTTTTTLSTKTSATTVSTAASMNLSTPAFVAIEQDTSDATDGTTDGNSTPSGISKINPTANSMIQHFSPQNIDEARMSSNCDDGME